jgi:hypothetical protein
MFSNHAKGIARDSLLFFITAMVLTVGAVALCGLIIGIGFFIIGILTKTGAGAAVGAFSVVGMPFVFALFIGIFCILPSAIAGMVFGFSAFISRSLNLPKVALLLFSMGAGYLAGHIGMPASAKDYIPSLALCAGLAVSATICYASYFKKFFSYPL